VVGNQHFGCCAASAFRVDVGGHGDVLITFLPTLRGSYSVIRGFHGGEVVVFWVAT
jgi:hypothetical protein